MIQYITIPWYRYREINIYLDQIAPSYASSCFQGGPTKTKKTIQTVSYNIHEALHQKVLWYLQTSQYQTSRAVHWSIPWNQAFSPPTMFSQQSSEPGVHFVFSWQELSEVKVTPAMLKSDDYIKKKKKSHKFCTRQSVNQIIPQSS